MEKTTLSRTMLILFQLTSSIALLEVTATLRCPDTWTIFGHSCYKFFVQQTSWFNAHDICKLAGGHVVKIQSRDEDQFVNNMARIHGASVWISLSDLLQEGHFVWSDTHQKPNYTHWALGEPSDSVGKENCGMLWYQVGSLWNDSPCEDKLSTICEKQLT